MFCTACINRDRDLSLHTAPTEPPLPSPHNLQCLPTKLLTLTITYRGEEEAAPVADPGRGARTQAVLA
jgi:hypothetical protein